MKYNDGLRSKRLYTRFLTESDAPIWVSYFDDPVNCRFMANPDNLSNTEQAERFIDFQLLRYNTGKLCLQAILLKESHELVGACGLLLQEVDGSQEIEVGYHFLRKYWGNGYATEAAQLFRDYGFEHNMAEHIVSMIDPRNEPSKKVAIRNGMNLHKEDAIFRGVPYNMFRITRTDWEQLK